MSMSKWETGGRGVRGVVAIINRGLMSCFPTRMYEYKDSYEGINGPV